MKITKLLANHSMKVGILMQKSVYICDACKTEANGRFLDVPPLGWFTVTNQIPTNPLRHKSRTVDRHFCSIECVYKWSIESISPASNEPMNEALLMQADRPECGTRLVPPVSNLDRMERAIELLRDSQQHGEAPDMEELHRLLYEDARH